LRQKRARLSALIAAVLSDSLLTLPNQGDFLWV
jgi:hypothetical protein